MKATQRDPVSKVVQRTKRILGYLWPGGSSPSVALPLELCLLIIAFVSDPHDLISLCCVSKAFYTEAVCLLYSDVTLTKSHAMIYSWLTHIIARPDLAQFVESLTVDIVEIQMRHWRHTERGKWFDHLFEGLRCLPNLKVYVIRSC
jgi:hypothetical protein